MCRGAGGTFTLAVQAELKKTNLLKDKLEELCRQLQKEAREVSAPEGMWRGFAGACNRVATECKGR